MVKTDESTLELDKPEIGLKVIVPFRQEIDSPESTADFVMLMPADVDKVIKGIARQDFYGSYTSPACHSCHRGQRQLRESIRDTKTKQDLLHSLS